MTLTIEPERPADADELRAIHRLARSCFPSAAEADLVSALRRDGDLTFSLVARAEGELVGYVAFSRVSPGRGLGLAPVAVGETHRRRGVAARLVDTGLAAAKEAGHEYVVVLGDPAYYRRFGFSPAERDGLSCVFGGGDAFQILRLGSAALPAPGTAIEYAPAFAALADAAHEAHEAPPGPGDRRRAVILGASNVTRGAATVAATAGRLLGTPLELLIAAGRGRSYGCWSRILARGLPPILDCGLWAWLERGPAPSHALVTDVGNDLLYGQAPERILLWVETCVARLRAMGTEVTVGRLPTERLERLGPKSYELARLVLVPRQRRIPFEEMLARIAAVDEGLASIAVSRGARSVVPSGAWYGIDPVHVKVACCPEAWRTLMASWARDEHVAPVRGSALAAVRLAATLPQHGTMFGARFGEAGGAPGSVQAAGVTVRLF